MARDLDLIDLASDASFERRLLESARADQLPDTAQAFEKFSASLGVVTLATAPGTAHQPFGSARRLALKWLTLGAVTGSALTALWLGGSRSPERAPTLRDAPPFAVVSGTNPPPSSASAASPPATSVEVPREPRSQPNGVRQRRAPTTPALQTPASTLLAEVAALDAVRAKLALRDAAAALDLLATYQRQFPQGQLANDAEALSIEASAAQGDRAEVQRRAATFLERAPDDPHAAQIRNMASEEARTAVPR